MKSLFLAIKEDPYLTSEKGVEKALFLSVSGPLIPIVLESRGACVAFACIKHAAVEMEVCFPYYQGRESVIKGS